MKEKDNWLSEHFQIYYITHNIKKRFDGILYEEKLAIIENTLTRRGASSIFKNLEFIY